MRTITKKVYTAAELKRKRDKAPFNHALEKYRENMDLEYNSEEMMDSLKALCETADVKMRDWSLGAYNRGNNLRVDIPGEDGAAELTDGRALAWIENRILGPLRAPWGLPKNSPGRWTSKEVAAGFNVEEGKPKRRWTAPGCVPSCPLTGVCYDEDFIEDLIKSVRAGRTIKEAFEDLADVFARMLEDEYEYQRKEEQFLEAADVNGWEYDEDGDMI